MDISKYIAELLFDFECVVIPGFGGFIINDKPSTVNRINHQFKPPFRLITLNTHLRTNDGLLVNQIASLENISFEEARQEVDVFVQQINQKLRKKEIYHFQKIGNIRYDDQDNIVFEQDTSVNYHPQSYGLSGFISPPVKRASDEEKLRQLIIPPRATSQKPVDRIGEPEQKTKRRFWPVYLFVALLLLLITIAWGIFNPAQVNRLLNVASEQLASIESIWINTGEKNVLNEARYIPRKVIESDKEILAEIERSKNIIKIPIAESDPVAPKKTNAVEHEQALPEQKASRTIIPETEAYSGPLYYIIAGSFQSEANAQNLVEDLKLKGFDASIADTNSSGMFRVAYTGIRRLSEAKEKLIAIRQEDNPDAWLFRK